MPEAEIQQAKAAASSLETVAEFAGPAGALVLVAGLLVRETRTLRRLERAAVA